MRLIIIVTKLIYSFANQDGSNIRNVMVILCLRQQAGRKPRGDISLSAYNANEMIINV